MSGVWDSTPALQCMSGRKSEEGNSGRAVENSLQPREMKVLGGGYSGGSQFPLGQGTLGSVIELVFCVEMKATIVVTPEVGICIWRPLS